MRSEMAATVQSQSRKDVAQAGQQAVFHHALQPVGSVLLVDPDIRHNIFGTLTRTDFSGVRFDAEHLDS